MCLSLSLVLEFIAASVVGIGFAIQFKVKRNHIILAIIGGSLGWIIYSFLIQVNYNSVISSFLAALFVATCSEISARIQKTPITMYLIIGIIPIVPGRGIYLTMLNIVESKYNTAMKIGAETIGISVVIAIAILLVNSISYLISLVYDKAKHYK